MFLNLGTDVAISLDDATRVSLALHGRTEFIGKGRGGGMSSTHEILGKDPQGAQIVAYDVVKITSDSIRLDDASNVVFEASPGASVSKLHENVPGGEISIQQLGTSDLGDAKSIQGVDVDNVLPSPADVLSFDGVRWRPAPADAKRISGQTVSSAAPASEQVLQFDGLEWSPATLDLTNATKIHGQPITPAMPSLGQIMQWAGSHWDYVTPPPAGFPHEQAVFRLEGEYSSHALGAFSTPHVRSGLDYSRLGIRLVRRTAGSAGATEIRVMRNGVFVTSVSVDAASGDYATSIANVNPIDGKSGDIIEVELMSIESVEAGPAGGPADLTVIVTFYE